MYVCVHACVRECVWGRSSWEKKDIREKRKGKRNKKEWREKKRRENKTILIQINTQTDRQIDRHKSFIDMRYNTEQYSKSNSIKENRIE